MSDEPHIEVRFLANTGEPEIAAEELALIRSVLPELIALAAAFDPDDD